MSLEVLGQHRYLPIPRISPKHTWLRVHGLGKLPYYDALPNHDLSKPPSLLLTRALIAFGIMKACNSSVFSESVREDELQPTENERLQYIKLLSAYATVTGLLHSSEIPILKQTSIELGMPSLITKTMDLVNDSMPLADLEEVANRSKKLSEQGHLIVAFQGTFHSPTITHLAITTAATMLLQEAEIPTHLIWIFDGDELIHNRKGYASPYYSVESRQRSINGLWQVGDTCVSTVTNDKDLQGYINEYRKLHVGAVLLTEDQQTPSRLYTVNQAGAIALKLPYFIGWPSASSKFAQTQELIEKLDRH